MPPELFLRESVSFEVVDYRQTHSVVAMEHPLYIDITDDLLEQGLESIRPSKAKDFDDNKIRIGAEVDQQREFLTEFHLQPVAIKYSEDDSKMENTVPALKIKHRPPMLTEIQFVWQQFSIAKDGLNEAQNVSVQISSPWFVLPNQFIQSFQMSKYLTIKCGRSRRV